MRKPTMPRTASIRALAVLAGALAGGSALARTTMEHDHGAHSHHHAAPAAATPAPAAPHSHAGHHAEAPAQSHAEHHKADHTEHHAGHESHEHAGHQAAQDAPAPEPPMDHGSMQGGSAPPDARDPHAYSNGLKRGEGIYAVPGPRLKMADEHRFASLHVDTLERRFTYKGEDSTAYGLQAWYGGTYDRLVLKAEGEIESGKLEESRTELLWGRAVSAYWDAQLGARLDTGEGPDRHWLAFGVQGLAPYWFELEATGYVGAGGRTALRLEASYELLLSQEITLEPKIEMQFFGKNDPARRTGSGLAKASAGLRLRYEITPRFAPYIGVERSASFGRTAGYIREDGGRAQQTRFVAGLRFWF